MMMSTPMIRDNVAALLRELPSGVTLVAAAKSRSPREVLEAVEAGVGIIGENYVQEAEAAAAAVDRRAAWHFIGHLQKNMVRTAVRLFDLIQTVDSVGLAAEIDRRAAESGKVMPVFIEVNSGREPQKFGVMPEAAEALVRELGGLPHIRVEGLMTMGPETGDPEDSRPYFRLTRELYERLRGLDLPRARLAWLSMGMSHSYRVAVEEGANMVRIGTRIFGPRGTD
jgi:pyridoxal phosphate enzyme (YggS family)